MALILRWFHHNGERHRIYYESSGGEAAVHERALMVGARDWAVRVDAPAPARLESLTEAELAGLAEAARELAARSEASAGTCS